MLIQVPLQKKFLTKIDSPNLDYTYCQLLQSFLIHKDYN